jgi:ribonucleoside-diphosphate reductase alpha chain
MNSIEYFKGDELAASVWEGKYAAEGESNPDEMHKRMAKEFARIEEKYMLKEVYGKTFESILI